MKCRLLLSIICLCAVSGTAQAVPISFTLGSSLLSTLPGTSVTFTGTLTELGGTTTFLNGDSFTTTLPLNDTPFLLNFPLTLSPLQTFTAAMFSVSVPAATLPGVYSGTFSILGGTNALAATVLGTQQFGVSSCRERCLSRQPSGCSSRAARRWSARGARGCGADRLYTKRFRTVTYPNLARDRSADGRQVLQRANVRPMPRAHRWQRADCGRVERIKRVSLRPF